MHFSTTFYNFTEVWDRPFTMALFTGYKNNSDCYLVGQDHEVGFSLYFGIDKRRGRSGIAARIFWFWLGRKIKVLSPIVTWGLIV